MLTPVFHLIACWQVLHSIPPLFNSWEWEKAMILTDYFGRSLIISPAIFPAGSWETFFLLRNIFLQLRPPQLKEKLTTKHQDFETFHSTTRKYSIRSDHFQWNHSSCKPRKNVLPLSGFRKEQISLNNRLQICIQNFIKQ